jgi:hypothetical protein
VDLKLTEVLSTRFSDFRKGVATSKLNEAKLKLLESTNNKWLKILVENKEVKEAGSNKTLVIEFVSKLKVVKNQFRTVEDKELKEKLVLNADIKVKLPEKT